MALLSTFLSLMTVYSTLISCLVWVIVRPNKASKILRNSFSDLIQCFACTLGLDVLFFLKSKLDYTICSLI